MQYTKSPIVVFDLHGVVFRPDYREILRVVFAAPKKYKLVLSVFDPRFWHTVFHLIKKVAVPEEYIMKLSTRVPYLQSYIQSGLDLANAQRPQEETVDLIHELKKRNVPLYVFSNIGEKTYAQLLLKFPEIMGLFEGAVVTSSHDDYLKKPRKEAFEKYARTFGHNLADLIFIDNKRKNIRSSISYGVDGIYFKNPNQLRDELEVRNLI